jgi:hypothetical protein
MSFEYTIKAIPTKYKGVMFRSRLEATWAAYFDNACIRWDYEPIDLEGWTPDFILRLEDTQMLVEVKPVDLASDSIGRYVESTGIGYVHRAFPHKNLYKKAFDHSEKYDVLLLGLSPVFRQKRNRDEVSTWTYQGIKVKNTSNTQGEGSYNTTLFRLETLEKPEDIYTSEMNWTKAKNTVQKKYA